LTKELLEIIIKAVDNASKEIGDVTKGIGKMGKVVGGLALGGLAIGAAATAGALVGLGKGLAFAIEEAMGAEEVMAQLDAVLASTGKTATIVINEMTDEAKKKVEGLTNDMADKNKDMLGLQQDFASAQVRLQGELASALEDIAERHTDKIKDLEASIRDTVQDYERDRLKDREDFNTKMVRSEEDYTHDRAEMIEDLAAAETEAEKARIQERINDFDYEYETKRKRAEEDQAREEQRALEENALKLRAIEERIAAENQEFAKQEQDTRARYAREVQETKAKYDAELAEIDRFIKEAQQKVSDLTTTPITLSVLRPAKEAILGLADSLSETTRYEDDAILSGENLLLTFKNIGASVFPDATTAMLDMSTAMGQDLKSSAIQIGKALNDPITGMSALQRVGVTFTEEQKDVVEAMMKTGDIVGAQKIILEELRSEFGGSAEAAGSTFAGQLDILKNSLGNAAEEIGMAVLPALKDLATGLIEFVRSDEFQGWVEKVIVWLKDELPVAIQTATDYWNNVLLPALQEFWPILRDDILPALQDLVLFFFVKIPDAVEKLSESWKKAQDDSQVTAGKIIDDATAIINKWHEAQDNYQWIGGKIIEQATRIIEQFWLMKDAVDNSVSAVEGIWQGLQDAIDLGAAFIIDKATAIISKYWEIKDAVRDVRDTVDKTITRIGELTTALANMILPDWLVPGSPTPLELGLRGINDAMSKLAGATLPTMNAGFTAMPATVGGASMSGGMGGSTVVVNFNSPVLGFSDEYALADQLAAILKRKGAI
jgi:hypothetical protein